MELEVDEATRQKNKELTEKYPFLLPYNVWTGNLVDDYDYEYTLLDEMPEGWRKAFGEQMCEEIAEAAREAGILDSYVVVQIKEKYGSLRWYDNGYTKEIEKIICKYEELSRKTCIKCGAPATKVSTGWISPWCDECVKKLSGWERAIPIEDAYGEDSKYDLP